MNFQIVFVASNFVSERGDMVILDDIEILYETEGDDCGFEQEERKEQTDEKAATLSVTEPGENTVSFLRLSTMLFSITSDNREFTGF